MIVCRYNLLMGPALPTMPAYYTLTYPSIDSAAFAADYIYSGYSCGATETDYSIITIPADLSFTFMAIDAAHNVALDTVSYTGLPGVFQFTIQANGIIDPLLQNTDFSFTVELQCIFSIVP